MNEAFKAKAKGNAEILSVDFNNPEAAREIITKWATEKTKGGLDLTDFSYPASTKVALASSIYFKASWIYTFQPAVPGTFKTPNGEKTVQMMNMKRKFHSGEIGDYARWVSMPYKSEDSFIIILPHEGFTVDDVTEKMNERAFYNVLSDVDREDTMVRKISGFKLESFLI